MTCDVTERVDERLARILTQYRESPNLKGFLRVYLNAIAEMGGQVCDLPERFDLDTSTGDQLTLTGKALGWPRIHCVCDDDTIEIADDDLYRRFLKSRIRQIKGEFDLESLDAATRELFGPNGRVMGSSIGNVTVSPGRELSDFEIDLLQVFSRVLPVALGIRVLWHFDESRVFGFGAGWGGIDDVGGTEVGFDYSQAFGFGEGQGGICDIGGNELTFDKSLMFGFGFGHGGFCDQGTPFDNSLIFGFKDGHGGFCDPNETEASWLCAVDYQPRESSSWRDEFDIERGESSPWLCYFGLERGEPSPWMCQLNIDAYACD